MDTVEAALGVALCECCAEWVVVLPDGTEEGVEGYPTIYGGVLVFADSRGSKHIEVVFAPGTWSRLKPSGGKPGPVGAP